MKISSICILTLLLVMPIAFLGTTRALLTEISPLVEKNGWTLTQKQGDIEVYTKKEADSKIKSFKAIMEVKADLREVVAILMDFDNYSNWLADCAESKTLKKISPREYYYYFRTKAPWPLKDRDNIIHTTMKEDSKTGAVTFTLTTEPHFIPEKESVVRMKSFEGSWKLTPQKNHLIQIEHIAHADPGGAIPKWLINAAIVENPYHSLLNLRKLLQRLH